jgi:hypothetical protein
VQVLDSVPASALFLTMTDLVTNAVRYVQVCHHYRCACVCSRARNRVRVRARACVRVRACLRRACVRARTQA